MTDISSECDTNNGISSKFSCQTNPESLVDLWPAVDIYFNDDTCSSSYLTLAVRPGCYHSGQNSGFGAECLADGSLMSLQMFSSSDQCASDVPDNYFVIPAQTCLPVKSTISSSAHIASNLFQFTDSKLGLQLRGLDDVSNVDEMTYSGYYMARCDGY